MLVLGFAFDAVRVIAANAVRAGELDRDHGLIAVSFGAALVVSSLLAVGSFQLARRSSGRTAVGATIAAWGDVLAIASAVGVALARWYAIARWASPIAAIAIGAGFAVMVPRRFAALGIAAVAIPVLARVSPPDLDLIIELAWIAVAVSIARVASPRVEPRSARPRTLELASAALYGLSLCLPALAVTDRPLFGGGSHDTLVFGISCLFSGWFVIIGWAANPLLLAAAIAHAYDRPRLALRLAGLALVSAAIAPFLLLGGSMMTLRYPHVGYVAWVASMVCLAIAAGRAARKQRAAQCSL